MIQVKEMMQDKDLINSKSNGEGSRSRSQSMNDQSHYNQAKVKTKINKATSYKNVIGHTRMTTGKSTQGSKSRQTSASESATAEEPIHTTHDLEEPSHLEFETGAANDQPISETSQHPEWFSQQKKPPTPYRDWNKTLSATHGSIQPWISKLAKQTDSHSSFSELMDTFVDFSAFLMIRLKVDTFTPELLARPTYELMKGSCKSLQYPHNMLKPLPLIPNSRGRFVIPFDLFINNDLEYLRGGASSHKCTMSVTKTKAETMGTSSGLKTWCLTQCGFKNQESARDVYSKRRIIAVTELKIVKWYNYKHLDWITVRRDDDKLYKFKEGNFKRLRIQDIEDMLLLLKTFNSVSKATRRSSTSQGRIRTVPLKRKEAYTAYSNPRGFIYQNKDKQNRLMWIDELHKFSDGTLNDVRTTLDDHLKAKDEKDHEKLGEVCWWETVQRRLQDASTDHMIHHMMSLSFK
nr:hypothetical protein [Tanacetum cinerariifolium]